MRRLPDSEGQVSGSGRPGPPDECSQCVKRAMDQLLSHDPVTGVPNRLLFFDRLGQAVSRAAQARRRLGLLLLDLDRFKVVNDSLGPRAGDRLLRDVAARLGGHLRMGETLARPGGDEFGLLLPEVSFPEDLLRAARGVLEAIRPPFALDGREIFLTSSVGGCLFPADGRDPEILTKHAEIAMYRAKAMGGDCCQLFTPEMNRRASERLQMEGELRRALERKELTVYYQPEIDLASGRFAGIEALVRWIHPEKGMIPPRAFIPLSEEIGLIVPLGLEVLRAAATQAELLRRAGSRRIRVAVNVSLRQFQEADFPSQVRKILQETGADPDWIDLEVTESVAMDTAGSHMAAIRKLRSLGLHLSLDDFGRGYSSLSRLRLLPIETVKIDRSFVRKCTRDPRDASIARAIIAMAHSLDMRVVAEGVDRPELIDFFRNEGCDSIQGFHFARPMPASELLRWIDGWTGIRRVA